MRVSNIRGKMIGMVKGKTKEETKVGWIASPNCLAITPIGPP